MNAQVMRDDRDPDHDPPHVLEEAVVFDRSRAGGAGSKVRGAVGAAGLLAGALAIIYTHNPHDPSVMLVPCPFKITTGLNCPLCGGLRMTYSLMHGDVIAAVHDNIFALVAVPLAAGAVALRRRTTKWRPLFSVFWVSLVVTAVLWTIIRNIPGFPLQPAGP